MDVMWRKKERKKEHVPSVITSSKWLEIVELKELEKENQGKWLRKQNRINKKANLDIKKKVGKNPRSKVNKEMEGNETQDKNNNIQRKMERKKKKRR